MNINEYKQKKIKEINEFFQGIKFENIGLKDKKIFLGLTPECSDFFNKEEAYRKLTEMFLTKINGYYIDLIHTNIEYATTKEEIDYEINKFVDKVKYEIDNYKHMLIKVAFQPTKDEKIEIDDLREVKEKNTLNTGLNFIKIKIGDKIYSFPKSGTEAEKEDTVVENLIHIMIYIYILKGNIEDKKQKQEEFIDFVAEHFSVKDKEYLTVRKLQMIFINEKNYETFLQKYNTLIEELKSMIINRNNELISEQKLNKK